MDSKVLNAALQQRPFQPFTIRLVDGREDPIRHPEFVAALPRTIVVIHPDTEAVTVLEPGLIISLEGLRDAPPRNVTPKNE